MKKIIAPFCLIAALAGAQTIPLAHTNSLALEWSYPTNGVTSDLAFVLYSSPTLTNSPTNWPVLAVVSATNQMSWNGALYPSVNGTYETFAWPIAPTNQVQFYTIAGSNLTGVGVQASGPYPEVMPLENLTSFLMVEHP
ncbi:MAG TPA: hypothetical protein VK731_04990 [Candidatus Cybelea sp.]|jgi:hypothetical protein|nr:hypothetical protein [Candidatus Cybelea sp.]